MSSILSRGARATLTLAALYTTVACGDSHTSPTSPVISDAASLAKGGPNALPSRGLIVFSAALTGDYELYTANEDGSDLRRLTYHEGRDLLPDWSPDGRKIVFVRETDGKWDLWTIGADGSGARRLTFLEAGQFNVNHPRWSPDGRRIAFDHRDASNNSDIYTIEPNGRGLTRITTAPTYEGQPSWSPDGTRFAYTTQEYVAGPLRIWSMRTDGSDAASLVPCSSNDGCHDPAWSPDGTSLAYASESAVYSRRMSTGQTTYVAFDASRPAWSPDATKLAFSTVFLQSAELRVVGASGGTALTITPSNAQAGSGVSWKR